jgi:hypothetical protein
MPPTWFQIDRAQIAATRARTSAVAVALEGAGGARAGGRARLGQAARSLGTTIASSHLTRPGVPPARAGWDDGADLDRVVGDHHSVDEELDQLPTVRA